MRVADRVAVSPARRVAGAARARRQIHLASLRLARRHRRRPLHHCQLRARRRLRLDAACLAALGAIVSRRPRRRTTTRDGHHRRPRPARPARRARPLDCGNSGSTMRMLAGVLAAHPFLSTLTGDASLSRRPMRRVIGPLTADGRRHHRRPGDRPPLVIRGGDLHGIDFTPECPAPRSKPPCCWLVCRRRARPWSPSRPYRDHTERALAAFGAARATVAARRITARGRPAAHGLEAARARRHLVRGLHGRGRGRLPGSDVTITRRRPQPQPRRPARRAAAVRRRRRGPSKATGTASRSAGCRIRHGAMRDLVIERRRRCPR